MNVLSLDRVSHSYGPVSALREVSVDFRPGITGLLGPNGSGKTTLLSLACGYGRPRHGVISLDRRPVHERSARNDFGVLLQSRPLNPDWVGGDVVRVMAGLRRLDSPAAAAQRVLARVQLQDVADRRVRTYSLGQRQRLLLALALVHEPRVLLLDEPFNGLDPEVKERISGLLSGCAEDGCTVVLSSHVLPHVEQLAERVVVLVAGQVVAHGPIGTVRELTLEGRRQVLIQCSQARRLGAALAGRPWVLAVEYLSENPQDPPDLRVAVSDLAALAGELAALAQQSGVRLHRVVPVNAELDDVFAALIAP